MPPGSSVPTTALYRCKGRFTRETDAPCTTGGTQHSLEFVRVDAPIDPRVRMLVEALNQVPGVTTRTSCEGAGQGRATHRHADLAYVAFRRPLPLRFQEFLLASIGSVARVEDDGVYSRWPERNRAFIACALAATQNYLAQPQLAPYARVCWLLPRLRARLARHLSSGQDFCVQLCLECRDLVFEPHATAHRSLPLLRGGPEQAAVWFRAFAQQPRNELDPLLIAADGWANLILRTQRGEFGRAFQRRWLRYRARMLGDLATRQLRAVAEGARRKRPDLDFFYTDTRVVFEWTCD
jgi:hypothetical protein